MTNQAARRSHSPLFSLIEAPREIVSDPTAIPKTRRGTSGLVSDAAPANSPERPNEPEPTVFFLEKACESRCEQEGCHRRLESVDRLKGEPSICCQ